MMEAAAVRPPSSKASPARSSSRPGKGPGFIGPMAAPQRTREQPSGTRVGGLVVGSSLGWAGLYAGHAPLCTTPSATLLHLSAETARTFARRAAPALQRLPSHPALPVPSLVVASAGTTLTLTAASARVAAAHTTPTTSSPCPPAVASDDTDCWLVLPRTYGSLYSLLREEGPPLPSRQRALLTQLASLVAHCHRHGVVVGDLRLQKFLFVDATRTTLVLGDASCLKCEDDMDLPPALSRCGSPAYAAPEVLLGTSVNTRASDLWALGVATYLLAFSAYPFGDVDLAFLFTKVMTYPVDFPSLPPPNTRRLILALLDKNARARPAAQAVLDDLLHGWQTFANAEADSAAAGNTTTVVATMDKSASRRQHDHGDQHRVYSANAAATVFGVNSTALHPAKRTCRRRSDAPGQSATHTDTNDDAVVPLG